MERYEYRLEAVPTKSKRYKGLPKSEDAFALTVTDEINDLAKDGWEFFRIETINETRRAGLFGTKTETHEYMMYRRALRSNGMTLDEPHQPRRVKPTNVSNIEQLRARMHLAVSNTKSQ